MIFLKVAEFIIAIFHYVVYVFSSFMNIKNKCYYFGRKK